jgi:hypothetical protein
MSATTSTPVRGKSSSAARRSGPRLVPRPAPAPSIALVVAVQHLVGDCATLATGYGICARRAREADVADVAASLSTLHRAIADELAAFLATARASVPRTKSTCSERLRWEWLASTGLLVDGAPERPVLADCARIERAAEDHVVALRDEASRLALLELRQLATILQRARAASLRLDHARTEDSSTVFTYG